MRWLGEIEVRHVVTYHSFGMFCVSETIALVLWLQNRYCYVDRTVHTAILFV